MFCLLIYSVCSILLFRFGVQLCFRDIEDSDAFDTDLEDGEEGEDSDSEGEGRKAPMQLLMEVRIRRISFRKYDKTILNRKLIYICSCKPKHSGYILDFDWNYNRKRTKCSIT